MNRRPLDGIRILDATIFMVGPWASMLLGAMGAEVLHIEQPDVDWGKLSAAIPPLINGTSIGYLTWNMNKRGVFMDLKDPQDRSFAHSLIETCDVFLCNMRPGVPERLGMSYEELSSINPQLIYCLATGYGTTGPRADERGSDSVMQPVCGFWSTQGARGEHGEAYRHYTQIDGSTGNAVAQAILLALYSRRKTGKGQLVEVTMVDAGATLQLPRLAEHFAGEEHAPQGSSSFATAPDRAFLCSDQNWVGVSVTDEAEWLRLCRLLEDTELAGDARFETNADRVRNRAALEDLLVSIFAAKAQSYWIHSLKKAGIPCGIPMGWETLRHHEQVLANGYITSVDTDAWGSVWTGGPPWIFSQTPAHMSGTRVPGEATFELQNELSSRQGTVA